MKNKTHPTTPIVNKPPLPDPLAAPGGKRIRSRKAWPALARHWRGLVCDLEYGGMPRAPRSIRVETLCHSRVRRLEGAPRLFHYRVHCSGGKQPFSFCVRILLPDSQGPHPAVINGDGCWWYVSEDIARSVLRAGCALVLFNRTEFAEDQSRIGDDTHKGFYPEECQPAAGRNRRTGGLYDFAGTKSFGAVAAWAWGYHRCVDLLYRLPYIDTSRIAVTGHSRGGKTTLLAGALDERITLINDNASCAAGSALFRYVGHGGETIDIARRFTSWFGAELKKYVGREEKLPFDQHCLLACVAPRPLLLTYALDDRWSNPEGMVLCAEAAREVYRFLGAGDNLAFHLRPGGHSHAPEDWAVLLDFIAWKWQGRKPRRAYNKHPYRHLPQSPEVK